MANDAKFVGIKSIPYDDLVEIRDAINNEIIDREREIADGLAVSLAASLKQVLHGGYSVAIFTGELCEQSIVLTPADAKRVVVEIMPES